MKNWKNQKQITKPKNYTQKKSKKKKSRADMYMHI